VQDDHWIFLFSIPPVLRVARAGSDAFYAGLDNGAFPQ